MNEMYVVTQKDEKIIEFLSKQNTANQFMNVEIKKIKNYLFCVEEPNSFKEFYLNRKVDIIKEHPYFLYLKEHKKQLNNTYLISLSIKVFLNKFIEKHGKESQWLKKPHIKYGVESDLEKTKHYFNEILNLVNIFNSIKKNGFLIEESKKGHPVCFLKEKNNIYLIDGFNRFFSCLSLQKKEIYGLVYEK